MILKEKWQRELHIYWGQRTSSRKLLTYPSPKPTLTLTSHLGTDRYFFDGGEGVGKCWNKLFAEAVKTEINCTQKKNLFRGSRRHKKNCLHQEPHTKKNVCMWKISNPNPPSKKNNGFGEGHAGGQFPRNLEGPCLTKPRSGTQGHV